MDPGSQDPGFLRSYFHEKNPSLTLKWEVIFPILPHYFKRYTSNKYCIQSLLSKEFIWYTVCFCSPVFKVSSP